MTADHPTRTPDQGSEVPARQRAAEERYAAVLAEHMGCGPGEILTEFVGADTDGGPGEIAVGQACRSNAHNYAYWNGTCQFASDLAAALVAADCADGTSAEVSPERSSGESPAPAQCCDGTSQELSRGGVPRESSDAALSDDEWYEIRAECAPPTDYGILRGLIDSILAARAAQPVCCDGTSQEVSSQQDRDESPAPEVSRGVAEVKAVRPRRLLPHATHGDDPSGWCGCAGCDPRGNCGCRKCLFIEGD